MLKKDPVEVQFPYGFHGPIQMFGTQCPSVFIKNLIAQVFLVYMFSSNIDILTMFHW